MSSPIPSRSIDSDSNQSDSRARSVSSSNMSRTAISAVRQSTSRRSLTPKAKRKTVSNRSTPYVAAASSHPNRTTTSSITFDDDRSEFDEYVGQPSSMTNIDRSSNNAIAPRLSVRRDQASQERHAFERSSEETGDVNDFERMQPHQVYPSFRW